MQLRFTWGTTVARPLVEEIAEFVIQDYVRRRTVQGNPNLIRTFVHNFDIRWEWFPTTTEVLAASLFAKQFLHPIELTAEDQRGQTWRYQNADAAQSFGGEIEASFSLGRFAENLTSISFGANLLVAFSQIELPCTETTDGECAENYTNLDRPMAGQSPFVVNAQMGWEPADLPIELFLFYNVFGQRLVGVGLEGMEDEYELPFHRLDLTARWNIADDWSLKLAFKNLLFQHARNQIGSVITEEVETPFSFSLGLSYSY